MKFAVMVHHRVADFAGLSEAEIKSVIAQHDTFTAALKKAGVLINDRGFRLMPPEGMVRLANKALFDGPHAETKEVIGGLYILDVNDKASAVEWAKQHPTWRSDVVEVREIVDC